MTGTPTVARLNVHPVKSLDPHPLDVAEVVAGALRYDREYAILDGDHEYVNGKREPALHRLRTAFDPETRALTVTHAGDERTFSMDAERGDLNAFLSDVLGYPVLVTRDDAGGHPDDTDASGPTVIATGTLDTMASWFDDVDAAEIERRLRPNVVVDAEPFWEDRLYGPPGDPVRFRLGEVEVSGHNPCQRCVVPTRDPDTGEETPGFRETVMERREATLPPWAPEEWFDHYYRVMVNTSIDEDEWGGRIAVGDDVEILE